MFVLETKCFVNWWLDLQLVTYVICSLYNVNEINCTYKIMSVKHDMGCAEFSGATSFTNIFWLYSFVKYIVITARRIIWWLHMVLQIERKQKILLGSFQRLSGNKLSLVSLGKLTYHTPAIFQPLLRSKNVHLILNLLFV